MMPTREAPLTVREFYEYRRRRMQHYVDAAQAVLDTTPRGFMTDELLVRVGLSRGAPSTGEQVSFAKYLAANPEIVRETVHSNRVQWWSRKWRPDLARATTREGTAARA